MPTHTPIGTQTRLASAIKMNTRSMVSVARPADLQGLAQRRVLDQHQRRCATARARRPQRSARPTADRDCVWVAAAFYRVRRIGALHGPAGQQHGRRERPRSPPESSASGASWSAPRSRAPAPRAPARRGSGPPTPPSGRNSSWSYSRITISMVAIAQPMATQVFLLDGECNVGTDARQAPPWCARR